MKIEFRGVDSIIPYEDNPRKNEKAVRPVADSILKYGFRVPIVIGPDNVVITGHTRLKAAKLLNIKEVPVIVASDLTDEQITAFRLADNKTGELAKWDFERLERELEELDGDDFISRLFGIGQETVQKDKSMELDISDFDDEVFEYECPSCGFRFN